MAKDEVKITRGKNKILEVGSNYDSMGRPNFRPYVFLRASDNTVQGSSVIWFSFSPAESVQIGEALIEHGRRHGSRVTGLPRSSGIEAEG